MRALLLAAGLGTRLRPLTDTVPKAMVDIAGRPLLDRWLAMLVKGGIERVLVNTHYLGPVIRSFVQSSRWSGSVDLVDEAVLLGTGGTLLANRRWFGEKPLLVTHGDNASDLDVAAFIRAHAGRPSNVLATMALFRTDHPQSCGIVLMDQNRIIREFHEKKVDPPGNLANAAAFIFEPDIFTYLEAAGKSVIDLSADIIPALMGRIQGFEIEGYHRDIGTPESLAMARQHYRNA
jgi:mannose-1-phosphate guanylyltransferase